MLRNHMSIAWESYIESEKTVNIRDATLRERSSVVGHVMFEL